jgi:hypothetical protein
MGREHKHVEQPAGAEVQRETADRIHQDADQTAADMDQTQAHADRAASYADQVASDADQALQTESSTLPIGRLRLMLHASISSALTLQGQKRLLALTREAAQRERDSTASARARTTIDRMATRFPRARPRVGIASRGPATIAAGLG